MSRRPTNSIALHVDKDGITVPAQLRPPGQRRGCWHVRFKAEGVWVTRATGEKVRLEAERAAREIVRGKPREAPLSATLSCERFVQVQEKHYAQKADQRKAAKTLAKFRTVWDDFKRYSSEVRRGQVHYIQQITEQEAIQYVEWLKSKEASAFGIHSKIAVLRAAWNRVRRDHPKSKKTLTESEKVRANPWEGIVGELPERIEKDPIQLDLGRGDLQALLKAFDGRPVAQLFLIVSMWGAGRLEEMTLARWEWVDQHGYIDIPDEIAKWGKGRVVRLPLGILEQLIACRVAGSPYVFAGFVTEYRRRSGRHGKRVKDYGPGTYDLICKHIVRAAKSVGIEGVSHHALRRTAMELSDQGEEIKATDESSRNLGTTTKNKEGFYVRKSHGRTFYLRADRLYASLSVALLHYPEVADLMMVEERFRLKTIEPSEERVRRLLQEIESLTAEELLELERQKARRQRKKG